MVAGVAVVVAVGVVAWLLLRGGDGGQRSSRAHSAQSLVPRLVGVEQLRAYASARGPVYWAGMRPRTMLEFSRRPSGTFVRYLPDGAEAGQKRARLTVATYALPDALAAVERSGRAKGARLTRLPGGGVAVTSLATPDNAYVAYPGRPVQVEVFDPRAGRALALVRAGRVVPVATR